MLRSLIVFTEKLTETLPGKEQIEQPTVDASSSTPVKTIIHQLNSEPSVLETKIRAVDFVSEDDVRRAIEKGEKYLSIQKQSSHLLPGIWGARKNFCKDLML